MKRLFVQCLFVLLAAVGLVAAIKFDPGYLLLSYGFYTIETSIWIGLAAVIIIFAVIFVLFSSLRTVIYRSSAIQQWFSERGHKKSQKQTTQGLIAFIEGNWTSSRTILAAAAQRSETPLLNYLIAARACHELGDHKQVKEFLQKAEKSTQGADIAVDLTQAELQLRSGHLEQALATLTRLRRNAGKHPHVLRLLKKAYEGLNDWQAILDLLPELRKFKVYDEETLSQLELIASKARIDDIAKTQDDSINKLLSFWSKSPKSVSRNSELVACYVEKVMQLGGQAQAERLIRRQLTREWNKHLVVLYGKIADGDAGKALLHAEAWLQERNNDATLMLTLGRLSLQNSLWAKAREYFENSLKLEKSAEAYAELGRLLSHLGEHEKSSEYFYKGLLLMTNDLPPLPMPE